MCYTTLEPVGVCAQIIPWNFPIMMAAWKFGPCLAAGCVTILKPSEKTPLSAIFLGVLAKQAGFVIKFCFPVASSLYASSFITPRPSFFGGADIGSSPFSP